jgi:hypothetical protein
MVKIPAITVQNVKYMPNKIVINQYIDLVWQDGKPVIHVAGKTFRQCSFLAVTIPVEKAMDIQGPDIIDQIKSMRDARMLHGVQDVDEYLHKVGNLGLEEHITPETIMQAHASNLQAWAENDYNPEILASNLSFPLLAELADVGDEKAKRVLESEVNRRIIEGNIYTRTAILRSKVGKYLTPAAFDVLSKDVNTGIRVFVAGNENAPPEILGRLASDISTDVRARVAENSSLPAESLVSLATDKDEHVRGQVALNASIPPGVLAEMGNDHSAIVRRAVAANKSTPPGILAMLATDADVYVKSSIASNPDAPGEALATLANDERQHIRSKVAANKSTPPEILLKLSQDRNPFTRAAVAMNKNAPIEVKRAIENDVAYHAQYSSRRKGRSFDEK